MPNNKNKSLNFMLSGQRYEHLIRITKEVCKTKERHECRYFVKTAFLRKLQKISVKKDMMFGVYYVFLLIQKMLLEKVIYKQHVIESPQIELAEHLLLQYIFVDPDRRTSVILVNNIKSYYEALNEKLFLQRHKSLIANFNEIIELVKRLIDEL